MSGQFLLTLAEPKSIRDAFRGIFMKGHHQPRIAMVGRSNVGKSSLINALIGGRLARTSAEPGKTRSIHCYLWKEADKIIADLPGYGYARVSQVERDRWANFIQVYFSADEGLERAIILLDARHGPTELDYRAIDFLGSVGVPLTFVFTKADTLRTQSERASRRKEAFQALKELGYTQSEAIFWVSSRTKDGLSILSKELARELSKSVGKRKDKDA